HVKLTVASEGKTFDVLAFNNTEYYYSLEIGDLIDVVGGMNLNTWKSRISLQVIVKDLASKSLQVLDLRFDEKWKEHLGRIRQQEIVLFNDEYFLDHDKLESSSTYVLVPKRLRVSLVDLLSKELLGKCYRILEDAKEIEIHLFAHEAAVDIRQAMLIVKIFTELGFATFTTDRLIFQKPNGRRELTESDTYVTRLRQAKLIDRIYTEKNQSLPELARNLMEA
ncbi:MAG: single-stranded-DNA-specific exonuclease C-terminal domain-containing protein, partial [Bacilli bacterium]|nr:single-stranded-DNA-specific exonuclease C-terminal domain-containing protein [Bacilli bacterium]